jgi:uncharacterized protein
MKKIFIISACLLFLNAHLLEAQSYLANKNETQVKVPATISLKAFALPLSNITLLDGPFRKSMQLDSSYLMTINPNRLLTRFYLNANFPPRDSVYGGWESSGLSGHTMGHYLSAISMMYASTHQNEFKKRAAYIINEIAICQAKRNTGYVGAIPEEDALWQKVRNGQIKSSGFDLNGAWSPWYTVHKLMAGLMDAYLYLDNQQALDVATKMADWTYDLMVPMKDSVRNKMLLCEYGGMNEVLANIYAVTGNKKYLKVANLFEDDFVMGKLAQKIDPMPGKHSNTNVPKAISAARQFELTGNAKDATIASFFWETMVKSHSYVIGGNSNYEYCGDAGKLNDRLSDNTCETCNTYNMLKLTRHLFSWQPKGSLMDYYERALYNHILSSQNSKTGMMTYFLPLRMGAAKEFSDPFNTFTCCVGSGLENHSKHGESIYFEGADGSLYINLFIASALNWEKNNMKIVQETKFPYKNSTSIQIKSTTKKQFALRIRKPIWNEGALKIKINNQPVKAVVDENGYVVLDRVWNPNDKVVVTFNLQLKTESIPDNKNRVAFLYGPIVLAGVLGDKLPDPVFGTPVIMNNNLPTKNVTAVDLNTLKFKWNHIGKPFDVTMAPLFSINDDFYSVYWDKFTTAEWENKEKDYQAEKQRLSEIQSRTIDVFRIGEMQPERDHQLVATERSYVSNAIGRMGREARLNNEFSFTMKVIPSTPSSLLLTYIGDDKNSIFDILINGKKLTTVNWDGAQSNRFYDVEYALPTDLKENTIKVTILANHEKTAGRIFGVSILKK